LLVVDHIPALPGLVFAALLWGGWLVQVVRSRG
jgi:hypothetical protein